MSIKQIYDWKNLSGVFVWWWLKRVAWSTSLVAFEPKSNSASKHSEVWVSLLYFNPLQWPAPSYPDYSSKKKKLLVIRSGCVELYKRRKPRLIIISKVNRLKNNSDIHWVFEIQDFYQAFDLKGLFSEK